MTFDGIEWGAGEFTLAGSTFRLQHEAVEQTAPDAFLFYKTRDQVEQFERFLGETGFVPRRVLELGIWDGGSAAFWVETLGLERYSAVDLQTRGDSDYFERWHTARGGERTRTHWGVDQADRAVLQRILVEDGLEPLDLVLDDCSHQRGPTLASFEILFPGVRPGGWYVIEDWAWALQPAFQDRSHPWGLLPSLHPVVHALVDLHGSRPDVIAGLRVFPDFVAVERGPAVLTRLDVSRATARRPRPWGRLARDRGRRVAGRAARAVGLRR